MESQVYVDNIRDTIKQLRIDVDSLTNQVKHESLETKKKARMKYHSIKDEINELDKLLDRIGEITDKSWHAMKTDVDEMVSNISSEIKEYKQEVKN